VLWMLDTDSLSDFINRPEGRVSQGLKRIGSENVCVSIVTAAEVLFGAERKGSENLLQRIERALGSVEVLPFASPGERHYARIRTRLANAGTPIGANDLWIAAHALTIDATLVTGNTREFARVPGLRLENWLAG
jgi:tRNA(fMet)-specific endonuclease VapC